MLVIILWVFSPLFSFSWELARPEITETKVLSCLEVADVERKSQLSSEAEQSGPAWWRLRRQAAWGPGHSGAGSSSLPGPSRSDSERDAVCLEILTRCAVAFARRGLCQPSSPCLGPDSGFSQGQQGMIRSGVQQNSQD